jgi:hypothetical protein
MDHRPAWFTWLHLKVLVAIERCRTAAMVAIWTSAPPAAIVPSPTTPARGPLWGRHCPKCQSQARDRWLAARRAELLSTPTHTSSLDLFLLRWADGCGRATYCRSNQTAFSTGGPSMLKSLQSIAYHRSSAWPARSDPLRSRYLNSAMGLTFSLPGGLVLPERSDKSLRRYSLNRLLRPPRPCLTSTLDRH